MPITDVVVLSQTEFNDLITRLESAEKQIKQILESLNQEKSIVKKKEQKDSSKEKVKEKASKVTKANKKYQPGNKYGKWTIIEYLGCKNGSKDAFVKVQCECGMIEEICVSRFRQKNSEHNWCCSVCKKNNYPMSSYETKIAEMLDEEKIPYGIQKTMYDCKSDKGKALKFDFWLFEHNVFIEVQGEQHYEEWTLGDDTLEERIRRDEIKKNYCKEKKHHLLVIPYEEIKYMNSYELKHKIIELSLQKL